MAGASAKELLGQLLRARDLGFLPTERFRYYDLRIDEIRRMLWSLAEEVRRQHGRDQ
jgi:hypothetical protein